MSNPEPVVDHTTWSQPRPWPPLPTGTMVRSKAFPWFGRVLFQHRDLTYVAWETGEHFAAWTGNIYGLWQ